MFAKFPLFQSHIDLAHKYWQQLVLSGDVVIDATCGNGHDALVLAKLALTSSSGKLFAFDLQQAALDNSTKLLKENLTQDQNTRIELIQGCHSKFPEGILPETVKLIVYNLGYLPGGDKSKTTLVSTTLESIQQALKLLVPGGAISLTCYPGHHEGKIEEAAIIELMASLDAKLWSCCHHRWINRRQSPNLVIIQKGIPIH